MPTHHLQAHHRGEEPARPTCIHLHPLVKSGLRRHVNGMYAANKVWGQQTRPWKHQPHKSSNKRSGTVCHQPLIVGALQKASSSSEAAVPGKLLAGKDLQGTLQKTLCTNIRLDTNRKGKAATIFRVPPHAMIDGRKPRPHALNPHRSSNPGKHLKHASWPHVEVQKLCNLTLAVLTKDTQIPLQVRGVVVVRSGPAPLQLLVCHKGFHART